MSYWKTSKFQRLKKEWDEKLFQSGFRDIEEYPEVIHYDTAHFMDKEATMVYFREAGAYLHRGEFSGPLDKSIWFLHSEGYSIREISKVVRTSRETVSKTILDHAAKLWDNIR